MRLGHARTAQRITLLDLLALLDTDLHHDTRHWCTHRPRVRRRLLTGNGLNSGVLVLHRDSTDLSPYKLDTPKNARQDSFFFRTHFAINLEPDVALRTALDHRSDSHQTNDQGFALLDGDMHLLADVGTTQEVTCGNDTASDREQSVKKRRKARRER